jgi:hypothetical protein
LTVEAACKRFRISDQCCPKDEIEMRYMLLRMSEMDMKSGEIDLKLQQRALRSGDDFSSRNAVFSSSHLQKNHELDLNRRKIQ